MYQIQSDKLAYFNKEINSYNRKITYRFTLNDKDLPIDQVMDNLVITTDSGLEQYGVGSALVAQLQMSVKKEVMILPKDKIKVEIGLEIFHEVTQQWETIYSPLGVFFVDTIEETGIVKKLKAYDGMYKLNKGYFPSSKHTTTQAIANDIANANGYKVNGVINVGVNNEQLEGKNCNEMLSLVASAMGRNVRINRSGDAIEFIEPIATNLTFNENHLTTATLDDTTSYNITKLRVNYSDKVTNDEGTVTDEGYFTVGSGTDANTLELNNPLLKGQQAQANSVLIAIKKLNGYKRFDTTMPLADYRIEPMDMVTYSKGGVNYLVPILYSKMVLSYQGVSIETQSPTLAPTKSEFSFKGTLTQKVENLYTDIIQVKQLTANKVTTDELEATVATIEKLYATKAEIGELVAGTIVVENLKAQIAEVSQLVANKADINQLNALNATINSLKAQVGEIDNLIAGSILSQIIQSGSISSDLLNVKDGFIKDAMISSLSASKINSGVINTNNVNITSENGGMLLQGNLLQFKDKSGKVRIQIGQDTKGNYTFTLYDSTGKGVLINEQGIQSSNAIKDGLIVDSKVAGNANISGSKLNISSLYDSMNADGSKTLKASKVHLDDKGQTLDVSFKEMTTKQDGLENTMNTAITDISVSKGQISQLIQDTTITTANGTTTLKDAYNSTKSTVDSHTTSIGNMQSTINSHTGEIQSVKSETASIKAGLGKIELDVKTNYHTKTEVDNKINGIQIGGRNLIKNSALNGNSNWQNANVDTSKKYENCNSLKFTGSSSSYSSTTPAKLGDVFTISAKSFIETSGGNLPLIIFEEYKSDGTTNRIYFQETSVPSTANSWQTYTKTWTVGHSETTHVRVRFYNRRASFNWWVSQPMLEKGNKATDYTVAPEDVETSITTAKNEVKEYTNSQISIAKNEINLGVKNTYETKTEVTNKVNTAINNVQIGSRNLIKNSNFIVQATSSSFATSKSIDLVTGLNLNEVFLGKTVTLSYFVHNPGSKTNGSGDLGSRFGIHGVVHWKNSSTGATTTHYPFADCLKGTYKNTRVSMTCTLTPPSGYDTISGFGFSFQPYAKPSSDNKEVWKIGQPKLEIGTKSTDWSPAPEDVDASITTAKNEVKEYTNSQIQIAKDAINLGVSQNYETKAEVTNKVNNAVNGIQVGTQNLIKQTKYLSETNKGDWKISGTGAEGFNKLEIVTTNNAWQECQIPLYTEISSLTSKVTISFEYYETTPNLLVFNFGVYNANGTTHLKELDNTLVSSKFKVLSTYGTWKRVSYTFDPTSLRGVENSTNYRVQFKKNYGHTGTIYVRKPKLEVGTTASNWSPAPEDTELLVSNTKTEVKQYADSQIQIAKNAITQSVSSTYETKTEVTNKINGIQLGTRNLALKSNKEFTNNDYLTAWYTTSELFKVGEEYTVTLCVTPAKGVSYYGLYVSGGWKYLAPLYVNGTSKQTVSATFRFDGYHADKTPTSPAHGDANYNVHRFPNNNTVTSKSTIHWIKVEKGNKPTDFTPAPEDGESKITELTTRVSKAEQKITDSAIIQTVSQTINNAKTEATNNANTNTANQLKNYSTTQQMNSAIQQKADSITSEVVKIEKSMAIDNLLANGNFTNGISNWKYVDSGAPVSYTISANTDWVMKGKNALLLMATNHPQGHDGGFTQVVEVKRNTTYTFTGYVASHRAEGMVIIKDKSGNWLVFDKTNPDVDSYPGTDDITKWKRIRIVYNSGDRTELLLHLALAKSNNNGHVWFHDFMVTEGNTDLCWKPSERETRTKISQLDNRITSTVSSIETVDGKVNSAQSQINQQANQIASKVNTGDFASLVQQNGHSVMVSINNSRSSMGVGIDTHGLYGYNNGIATFRLTEGKFHAYNSTNGGHMGYFGTIGSDLRANLFGANTFSVYSDDRALLFRARYIRDANYGNATLDMCGGINFIHKPGQDVGLNQILLGNDDRSDAYGYHNMSIRCWNTLGFQDNYGWTNMFFDVRRGRIIMKGGLYQNTTTPPRSFSMNFDGEDEVYNSGFTRDMAVDSVMNLRTGVYVDNDGQCCSAIYGGHDELVTTEYTDEDGIVTKHLNVEALNASLVVTCQEQQKQIDKLQQELAEIKRMLVQTLK